MACSCKAIIKALVALFKHPFLSHPHQSSLHLPIVCLINCPCNCFCVHCVSLSFFSCFCTHLVFLYFHRLLLYMEQLTISLCCFLHNFLTPKLLSPPYPLLPSLPQRYNRSTLLLGWNPLCTVSNFLILLSIYSS